jgi:AcrR family transcriptional regulator
MRRTPVQERSLDTIQQIYQGTSVLLAEMPLEQITTSRIAEAAGISVGALYRFFPDKQEIIDAIAVRHMEDFRGRLQRLLVKSLLAKGPEFLGRVVDAYVAFLDERPDFRAIALGQHVSAAARSQQMAPGAGPGGLVRLFMIEWLGVKSSTSLDLKLRIATEAGERLIRYAYAQPTVEERRQVLAELKELLSRYLF